MGSASRETHMEVEEPMTGYRWETDYEKTWEAIKENEAGLLQPSIEDMIQRNKRRRALQKKNLRLGIMRHLFIVLDFSEAMMRNDLKPSRINCTLKILELFLSEFSDLNPISQVGIILTRNKKFEVLSPMSSDMKAKIGALSKLKNVPCSGEPSLQNSLEAALTTLRHMPSHTSKEILIILGSLTTCDPGDIHATIQTLSSVNIRCSVVGLSAEVKVCKTLVTETKGSYDVVIDDNHFKNSVFDHLNPPPAKKGTQSSLIRMGFSQYVHDDKEMPAMCTCHLDKGTNFSHHGYFCPQCQAKYCDLPVGCHVCGLTLVSAAHLARSFHHLFPVELFKEIKVDDTTSNRCFACSKVLQVEQNDAAQCTVCSNIFCLDCDIFIHENLHFCPGCSTDLRKESSSIELATSSANKRQPHTTPNGTIKS